jgi:hypothetical protein
MFKTEPTFSTPEITPEIAQSIYALIKEFGDADKAYKLKGNSDFEPEHFPIVEKEIERLASEINSRMSGSYLLEPAYPATYTEEGEIDEEAVPAVYYEATTKTKLIEDVSSDLLDVETLLDDLMGGETWTNYKTKFNTNEGS